MLLQVGEGRNVERGRDAPSTFLADTRVSAGSNFQNNKVNWRFLEKSSRTLCFRLCLRNDRLRVFPVLRHFELEPHWHDGDERDDGGDGKRELRGDVLPQQAADVGGGQGDEPQAGGEEAEGGAAQVGGDDLADERLVGGGDESDAGAGDGEAGEVDPGGAGGGHQGDGAEGDGVEQEADDDADALAFFVSQPAAGDHERHHEKPEDAVEYADGGDVKRGDLLHVEAEEVERHAVGDVAHAVGDEDPGDDAAGEEHAEHGAEVLFEPGDVEGGALVADRVVLARPGHEDADDHGDDVERGGRP